MTHGHPYPIPYYEQGFATAQVGELGNAPLPVGTLEMPISAASYLYYKAETVLRTIEFTPLSTGPGTRIDYTGATGWDGTKFISTQTITMLDQLPTPVAYTVEVSDQAKRDEIRGYALATEQLTPHPGAWMGIRQADGWTEGTYSSLVQSESAATMSYDLAAEDWELAKAAFETANSAAITAWQTRLSNWLAAEQAKVPPNAALIADIERQQAAATLLTPQITAQGTLVEEEIDAIRDALPMQAWTSEQIDAISKNLITLEQDAFARWIAAEEKLEAYAVTAGPLWQLRTPFKRWVIHQMQHQTIGWLRTPTPGTAQPDLEMLGFVGASLSTEALAALSSNSIPALSTVQIGALTRQLLSFGDDSEDYKNVGTPACATMFGVLYTLEPTSAPIEGIVHVSIGPVLLGLTPEMCVGNLTKGFLPQYSPPVRVWDIPSQEVYDEVWPTIGPYWAQFNEASESSPGVAVGKFRIEAPTADKIYECDLYANPSTVTAVNITLRVLTERT